MFQEYSESFFQLCEEAFFPVVLFLFLPLSGLLGHFLLRQEAAISPVCLKDARLYAGDAGKETLLIGLGGIEGDFSALEAHAATGGRMKRLAYVLRCFLKEVGPFHRGGGAEPEADSEAFFSP